MDCPQCKSSQSKKNGFRRGKQSFQCKDCGYQYVKDPKPRTYPTEVKQLCWKMYLNGMGFREIARVTEIDHTTMINWVAEAGELLSDDPQDSEIPEITEIDELQTFEPIWQVIKCWQSFWYVTDGWKVYPMYIESEDHLVSKTYMTRVEGENTRLRHYLARLHRKTLCYSKSTLFLKYSLRLLQHYLRFNTLQFSA